MLILVDTDKAQKFECLKATDFLGDRIVITSLVDRIKSHVKWFSWNQVEAGGLRI